MDEVESVNLFSCGALCSRGSIQEHAAGFTYIYRSVDRHVVPSLHRNCRVTVAARFPAQRVKCLRSASSDPVILSEQRTWHRAGLAVTLCTCGAQTFLQLGALLSDLFARCRLLFLYRGETGFTRQNSRSQLTDPPIQCLQLTLVFRDDATRGLYLAHRRGGFLESLHSVQLGEIPFLHLLVLRDFSLQLPLASLLRLDSLPRPCHRRFGVLLLAVQRGHSRIESANAIFQL